MPSRPRKHEATWTVLEYFDRLLYGSFDDLGPNPDHGHGGIGARWSQTLCAAAWRVYMATWRDRAPHDHFSPPRPRRLEASDEQERDESSNA
jgi:hypothetical protein